jgi:hypothetical protein
MRVLAVCVSKPKPVQYRGKEFLSGINMEPASGPRFVRRTNIEGDTVNNVSWTNTEAVFKSTQKLRERYFSHLSIMARAAPFEETTPRTLGSSSRRLIAKSREKDLLASELW